MNTRFFSICYRLV